MTTPAPALAQDSTVADDRCALVTLADNGWIEAITLNALASEILRALGYRVELSIRDYDAILAGLADGSIDAFLNHWPGLMISQRFGDGLPNRVVPVNPVVNDVTMGLAVPFYLYDRGLQDLADLPGFRSDLSSVIVGVGRRNPINLVIEEMIEDPGLGLQGFAIEPVADGERHGLIARNMLNERDFAAFVLAPSPLYGDLDLRILAGQGDWFGTGGAPMVIEPLIRAELGQDCPNLVNFLEKLEIEVRALSALSAMMADAPDRLAVARAWIGGHPRWLQSVLDGIDDAAGRPASASSVAAGFEKITQ